MEKAVAPADAAKAADTELKDALKLPYPSNSLPTQLSLVYVNTPAKGTLLTASAQIAREFLTFSRAEGSKLRSLTSRHGLGR